MEFPLLPPREVRRHKKLGEMHFRARPKSVEDAERPRGLHTTHYIYIYIYKCTYIAAVSQPKFQDILTLCVAVCVFVC